MDLKFTPENINEIEVQNKHRPFYTLLDTPTMSNLSLFVKKGMGLETDAQALGAIGRYFSEEQGDIFKLLKLIATSLQNAGFLDRGENIEKAIEAEKAKVTARVPQDKTNVSAVSGSEENQVQSELVSI